MPITPYFAPTYFSPFYFGSFVEKAVETPPIELLDPTSPDRVLLEELGSLLDTSGAFGSVVFGKGQEIADFNSGPAPLAIIAPHGWTEDDSVDPDWIIRKLEFTIVILVGNDQAHSRYDELYDLSLIVSEIVETIRLNNGCLPKMSRVVSTQFDEKSRHPEQRAHLKGQFAYLIGHHL